MTEVKETKIRITYTNNIGNVGIDIIGVYIVLHNW